MLNSFIFFSLHFLSSPHFLSLSFILAPAFPHIFHSQFPHAGQRMHVRGRRGSGEVAAHPRGAHSTSRSLFSLSPYFIFFSPVLLHSFSRASSFHSSFIFLFILGVWCCVGIQSSFSLFHIDMKFLMVLKLFSLSFSRSLSLSFTFC